jgi:hypothetical protein
MQGHKARRFSSAPRRKRAAPAATRPESRAAPRTCGKAVPPRAAMNRRNTAPAAALKAINARLKVRPPPKITASAARARASQTCEAQGRRWSEPRDLVQRRNGPDPIEPASGNLIQHLYGLHDLIHVDVRGSAVDGDDLRRLRFVDRFESEDQLAPAREQRDGIPSRATESLNLRDHAPRGLAVCIKQSSGKTEKRLGVTYGNRDIGRISVSIGGNQILRPIRPTYAYTQCLEPKSPSASSAPASE